MKKRNILFLVFILLTILVFQNSLLELYKISFSDKLYSHILMIPLVSSFLLFAKKKRIFSKIQYSLIGMPILIIGGILYAFSKSQGASLNRNDLLSLMIFTAVICWIGGFIFSYGIEAFRKASFPLMFLGFMIPIPTVILNTLIPFLQMGSAEVTYALFKLLGVAVSREGFIFHLQGLSVQVAEECSGIRSALALFIVSVLTGHVLLRSNINRVVLALCAFPISVLKNGLRIITLCLLSVYIDMRILDSDLHRRGGIPFFVLALIMLGVVALVLKRLERSYKKHAE